VGPFLTRSSSSGFATQALVGIDGSGIELGLEGMRRALDDFRNTTNAGFQRDSAGLSVIIVGDEDDNGGDASVSQIDPSVVRPVEVYTEFLRGLKGGSLDHAPILVSAVVTLNASPRYEAVAHAENGIVVDIGDPDWGNQLSQIGAATFGLQRLFALSSTPVPGSVSVTVGGQATTDFTVNGNDVTLGTDPPQNAEVDITYTPGCA
jgi:hypothetical protein